MAVGVCMGVGVMGGRVQELVGSPVVRGVRWSLARVGLVRRVGLVGLAIGRKYYHCGNPSGNKTTAQVQYHYIDTRATGRKDGCRGGGDNHPAKSPRAKELLKQDGADSAHVLFGNAAGLEKGDAFLPDGTVFGTEGSEGFEHDGVTVFVSFLLGVA